MALPFFHAITGCDTVSAFFGVGKVTAWQVCNLTGDELTHAFLNIKFADIEQIQTSEHFKIIEKFVILLYDYKNYHPPNTHGSINAARQFLFVKKSRSLKNCPPTNDALLQHLKRAIYQGRFIWGTLSKICLDIPPATNWG
ncbi:hypothetical protein Bhyg_06404 [Pseudolycoriella hygida]|uniref:Uncharacterized protein n=1 Tax=Pseudolycoriella hygida TaxID=35572 RepID=A0A9Q0N0P2_9DIPT|nr:hypothetical protein Bhyg_06404 [Pseudolycoriella hygida]